MNVQKTKRTKSFFQHIQQSSPQRRVSFSKPWTPLTRPGAHTAKDKSTPVPRTTSFSRPSKSSLKLRNRNIGICTRNKKQDATSSTTVDARRRSQNDPTPAHLKYGMFRRLSKFRKPSQDTESPPILRRMSRDSKPILVARSSTFRPKTPSTSDKERPTLMKNIACPAIEPPLPPPRPATRHIIRLSQTDPIHLDIKPKRFPSMLWC